jgi:hypothetical protein
VSHITQLRGYPDISIVHNSDWSGPVTVIWHPDGTTVRWELEGSELISGKIRALPIGFPVNVATQAVAIAIRCAFSRHLVRVGEDVMGFRTGESNESNQGK